MIPKGSVDYYEVLQISPNAESEMIQRVYRLLAQRYHPDNQETGNAQRFRSIHEAYSVLSNPESRVQYDVAHKNHQHDRWRLVSMGPPSENDFGTERSIRVALLEVLYSRRRMEPGNPGLFPGELEKIVGTPREHLEFTTWYLIQKKLLQRSDSSRLVITAEGVDYLEEHSHGTAHIVRRLRAAGE
jgi:curved DNA-binding protein CbpA